MKNKVYKVKIYLDDSFNIKSTQCDCPRGEVKCSHAAALYIHAIHNFGRTDIECQWKKSKPVGAAPKSSLQLFLSTRAYSPLSREPTDEDREWLYKELSGYGKFTGLWWLLSPEPSIEPQNIPVCIVEDFLSSQLFTEKDSTEKEEFFKENMMVNNETIVKVADITTGQHTNDAWHTIRKGRLTASNFGAVLLAKRVTPSLLKRLKGEYDISGVKAIVWGNQHEATAKQQFSQTTGLTVKDTGLWLDNSRVLGASPDGLIGGDELVEVKCPYSIRHDMVEEGLKQKNFCLVCGAGNELILSTSHAYWHQIQGQLHISKRKYCYFVIWTTKDFKILKIVKDDSWASNLDNCNIPFLSKTFLLKTINIFIPCFGGCGSKDINVGLSFFGFHAITSAITCIVQLPSKLAYVQLQLVKHQIKFEDQLDLCIHFAYLSISMILISREAWDSLNLLVEFLF